MDGWCRITVAVAYARFNEEDVRRDLNPNQASVASEKKKQFLTLYAEFHYLLTLNDVLFTAFSIDFYNK